MEPWENIIRLHRIWKWNWK